MHPCDIDNGGCDQKCVKDVGQKFHCTCTPSEDFNLQEDGKTCVKIHPCDKETKGGCSQICNKKSSLAEEEEEEQRNTFTCSCIPGFELDEDGISCNKGNLVLLVILSYSVHLYQNRTELLCPLSSQQFYGRINSSVASYVRF